MRVVHVVTAFPRSVHDPITPWLVELVRSQRAAGIEASVLAPAYRAGPGVEAVSGVPVRRFRYAPGPLEVLTHDAAVPDRLRQRPWEILLLPGYVAGGCLAAARVGRTNPDVVHVHWPMPHALFGAVARIASGGSTAVVCSYYSVELNWVENRMPWLMPFLCWTIRTADGVTAISRSTAAAVSRLVSRSVAVIPFGAAIVDDGAPVERPALGSPDQPLRILFVGRLVERKGVEVLVRALATLRESRPAVLSVVGEGPRREAIREEARRCGVSEHVELRGRLDSRELERAYAGADIFVLPAVVDARGDTEGLGVVLLEALRFERPVVASAAGGIPDIIEEGETGWLVAPGDADALARTLARVASDPGRARQVAARGRAKVAAEFSWPRIVAATRETYGAAMETRHERSS